MTVLPLIGIFDESNWTQVHGYLAGICFITFMLYGLFLGNLLYKNRASYPEAEQSSIKCIYYNSYGLTLCVMMFIVSFALKGHGGVTAIFEWIAVLYQLNFFMITSFENSLYD